MTEQELEQYISQLIDSQFFSYERGKTMAKKSRNETTNTETMNTENRNVEKGDNTMMNENTNIQATNNSLSAHISNDMKELLNQFPSTVDGIQETVTKDGKEVTKREYTLVNPIGKRTTLTTFDSAIIESTEKIGLALHGRKVLDFAICRELANLNDAKKLESMGFKNIGEYASALFDLSRVTATQYARIGRVFIGSDYKIKSAILPSSLTKGHLIELLPMIEEDEDISAIEKAFIDGELSDSMSTSKMRKAVKQLRTAITVDENGLIEDKNHENNTSDEAPESGVAVEPTKESTKKENTETQAPETIETMVATILSNLESIKANFDKINAGGDVIIGYNEHINAIAALAKSAIGM